MQKRIIIDRRCGRLGNSIYRLANVISFSIDNNLTVWDASMHIMGYSKLFPNIDRRLFLVYPDSKMLPFSFKLSHEIQAMMIQCAGLSGMFKIYTNKEWKEIVLDLPRMFPPGVNTVILRGFHYNADDCVRRNAAYLRRFFAPAKQVISTAKSHFAGLAACSDVVVAVHIRHGDYRTWRDGQFFFELEYYAQAMDQMMKFLPRKKVQFILFSDDKGLNMSTFKGFNSVFSEHGAAIDWFLMSLCDYVIAPLYSTFSGWASFYGETPIFRLNGRNCPQSLSDFKFDLVLNNSREHNKSLEAT
jgi:Glycosyl transferase family 11